MEEAVRRKDEFLATLAHELHNPLVPMRDTTENNDPKVTFAIVSHEAVVYRRFPDFSPSSFSLRCWLHTANVESTPGTVAHVADRSMSI
jgi:hypothetical protein